MNLLKMNKPQCFIFSAAMVLGEDPRDLCTEIGHDGMDKVFPLDPPRCYRGHHIQEIQDLFLARGKCLYEVEPFPLSGHQGCDKRQPAYTQEQALERFKLRVLGREAILINPTHAVAWDGEMIYDPNGSIYPIERFHNLISAFCVGRI